MDATEDWLDNASAWLDQKIGKENMMNRWIDKNDPYSKMSPYAAESSINNYENFVNMVQIPNVLAQTILGVASR
jgi:hypothetical protein